MLWENLTDIVLKKFVALEMIAIKIAYNLPKSTPHIEYLERLHNGGIVDTVTRRRKNFVLTHRQSLLIRQVETTVYSGGRRIRVHKKYVDRSAPTDRWKRRLRYHRRHICFSDKEEEDRFGTIIGQSASSGKLRQLLRRDSSFCTDLLLRIFLVW